MVVSSMLVTLPASAQGQPDLERAKQLFDEGEKAEKEGNCSTALKSFRAAIVIIETPQLYLRAGRCEETLGNLVAALGDYQRASVLAQKDAVLMAAADRQATDITKRIPRISFVVPINAPANISVKVDGSAVADVGAGRLVNPGDHEVEATAPGYETFRQRIVLTAGATAAVTFEMKKIPPPSKPKPPEPEEDTRVLPWVLLGAGGATLGLSIGLGIQSFMLKQDAQSLAAGYGCRTFGYSVECGDEAAVTDAQRAELKDTELKQNVFFGTSIGVAVISAGFIATTISLLGSSKPSDAPQTGIVPFFTDTSGGVVARGEF